MKLWKNIMPEKKVINRPNRIKDIISFKSSTLNNHKNQLNLSLKERTQKNEKNETEESFKSSSDEENSKKMVNDLNIKTIQNNLTVNQFNTLKLISKTSISDFLGNKKAEKNKINNIKTIYPSIPSRNKYKENNGFKKKIKKTYYSTLYNNNSLLAKLRDNFNKLYNKSLKKTKEEMIQVLKKHKLKNLKKKIKIKIFSSNKTKKNTINSINDNNNNDTIYSPDTQKTSYPADNSGYSSSPMRNYYANQRQKNLLNSDIFIESSASSKSANKFEFSRNDLKMNKGYKRKVNYKEYMKEQNILNIKWKKKVGISDIEIKYNPEMISNLDFQYNSIKDEINLIAEGIHYFKISLFGNKDLLNAFNNRDLFSQININKTLEEMSAILSLVPKIILKEYYIYCDKFISIPEPKKEYIFNKIITNESECFNDNIKILYKIANFIKACFEVYIQLCSQVNEEMLLSKNDYDVLKAIFEKCRYYIGNLINFANNILKDYYFDKKIISKSKPILNSIKERLKDEKKTIFSVNFYNEPKKKNKKKESVLKEYIIKRIHKKKDKNLNIFAANINFQNDEYSQKIMRIRKALDNEAIQNKLDKIKLKKFGINTGKPMALIFSPLMTKMMKYIKKDSREKIIALRSTEKFFPSNDTQKEY